MTPKAWLLLSWIVVGTALLVVHVVVLFQALRGDQKARWFALIPPAAPVFAWLHGARIVPIVWGLLLALYVGLRSLVLLV